MQVLDDLELLIEAARNAGDIAKPYWRADPQVWEKDDNAGPVTEADLAVDRMLHEYLLSERNDYGWLSEETVDTEIRLSKERVFIVDPIDGTRSFIQGDKHWSHSLAIAEAGEVIAAVVYLPMRDQLYVAAKGHGAMLNDEKISISPRQTAGGASIIAAKPTFDTKHWLGDVPDFEKSFRPSLAYRLSLVAEGRFDVMMSLRDTWEWDVAAGTLLVTEAGGRVADRHGQTPIFNQRHPKLPGLVAAHAPLTKDILSRLRP